MREPVRRSAAVSDQTTSDQTTADAAIPATATSALARHNRSRLRTIGFRLIAVVLGCLVPLVALEVALRIFGPFLPGNYDTGQYIRRDPVLGHFHIPNYGGWIKTPHFTVRVDINAMGLRDPRTSYDKPPGVFRILALGDSYVEGAQVQANETLPAQLERVLTSSSAPVQVINGGVLGYGTTQEYLLLDQEGPKYKPDLIVLFFCHCNDIPNNNYRLELIDGDLSRALKPYFDLGKDGQLRLIPPPPPSTQVTIRQRLERSSMLYNILETGVVYKLELQNPREAFNAVDGLVEPTKGEFDVRPDGEWQRGWNITDAVLERLRDRAKEIGAPLVIVGIPDWRAVDTAYWQRDANKRRVESNQSSPDAPDMLLRTIAERLGVPYLSLKASIAPRVESDGMFSYFIPEDYHFTAEGDSLAAESVAAFLRDQAILPHP